MVDPMFRAQGAEAYLAVGKRLKQTQGREVVKELQKAAGMAVKPVTPLSRKKALERLPSSGGLAKRVSKAPQRVTSRVGNTTASVRVTVAGKKSGAYGANVGKVRHKTFGRKPWVEQSVTPGWFDDAVKEHEPDAVDTLVEVLTEFAERLTRPL